MIPRQAFVFTLLAVALVVPLDTATGRSLPNAAGTLFGAPRALSKDAALSGPLALLADVDPGPGVAKAAGQAGLPKSLRDLLAVGLMRLDGQGRVQVFIHTTGTVAAGVSALADAGVWVERVAEGQGIVQAWVAPQALQAVASLPGVARLRLPDYGVRLAGAVTTEGDAALGAAAARAAFGIDGSGLRVGVISDGVEGLAASQASGDLPAVDTTTCNTVAEGAVSPGAGAEGTAMLEIVHDLAPGAELWFGHFGFAFTGTVFDFMEAVNCLAQNVDIVVDDIGFLNVGPYDGTSTVSMNASDALNDPANRIRGYYNAVGNFARQHYEGFYSDSGLDFDFVDVPDTWDLHLFSATSETTDGGSGPACACADVIRLLPGGSLTARLQWDDPFGASGNDYDLFLLLDGVEVAVGGDPQDGDDDPTEFLPYTNETGSTQTLELAIGNFNGTAAPRTFDLFISCSPLDCETLANGALHNYNTRCSSVVNNSDAGRGVVSLGAIDVDDPGLDDVEPFSSCGPTNDGRIKPDAAAVDGVSVTGNGGFASTFFGTSAAAPHAAGIAALLLDCNAGLSREELRAAMLTMAIDLGPPGPDNEFGSGRIDALAAATSLTCGPAMSLEAPSVVGLGATFPLRVVTDPAPDVALSGFASEIVLPDGLTWQQRPNCEDEVQVGRVDLQPLAMCMALVSDILGGASHSVVSEIGPLPLAALDVPPGGAATLVEIDVTCNTAGVYDVVLTALPDSLFGAAYFDTSANEINVATVPVDVDGDTILNDVADTITIECNDTVDSDGDGCTDTQEVGPDELLGGRRDPYNFWDFYDPSRDRTVNLADFFAVLQRFASSGDPNIDPLSDPPPPPAYHPRFDRAGAAPGANIWELQPADGAISVLDFFAMLGQFGHSCG